MLDWAYHGGTHSASVETTFLSLLRSSTLKSCSVGCECNVNGCELFHWCSHTIPQQAASWTDTYTRCCVCPELRGITARGKSQCGEISTCHVPTEVLSAQIVEAGVMFPQGWQLWVWVPCQALAYHTDPLLPLPPAPPLAEGHNGSYYLLDVCLISSYSSWLAITEPQGAYCPPLCHRWGAAVAKQSLASI